MGFNWAMRLRTTLTNATRFTKMNWIDDPLLKVPPARRGNRTGAPRSVPLAKRGNLCPRSVLLAKRGEPAGGGQFTNFARTVGISLLTILILSLVACSAPPKRTATAPAPTTPASPTALEPAPQGVLQVAFLDVGQGDSALITFPNGKTMLIDGGETSEGVALVGKLRRLGVRQIDWLVATHPHSDHIGGLIQVLKAFPVAEVWDIGMPFESPVYRDFLLAARGARSPEGKRPKFRVVRRGLTLEPAPNVRVSVLAPSDPLLTGTRSDPNNNSIVMRLDAPGGSFLFTGDLEREGRARLYATRPNLRAEVLKVAHHGAENGTDRAFLSRVNPAVAVIPVGAGNRYGHPHRETLALLQGRCVYRTDLHGDIVMRLGADKKLQIATTRVAPTQPAAQTKPAPIVGTVIGNRNSKVYHRPDCRGLPKPQNQVRFRSAQEAERAGYRPHTCVLDE
jgi:competence protein ComEC